MHWERIHSAQQNQVPLSRWPENDTLHRRPEAAAGGELLPPSALAPAAHLTFGGGALPSPPRTQASRGKERSRAPAHGAAECKAQPGAVQNDTGLPLAWPPWSLTQEATGPPPCLAHRRGRRGSSCQGRLADGEQEPNRQVKMCGRRNAEQAA